MAALCVALGYTPAQYYALTLAERNAIATAVSTRK